MRTWRNRCGIGSNLFELGDACFGMAHDWTTHEIDLIVADYFAMLVKELAGQPFKKAEHRRALIDTIARSEGSIEFKHQNISAVMLGLGQPWIEGYKPKANFQGALVDGVLRWLDARPDWCLKAPQKPSRSGVSELPPLWIGPAPAQRNEPPPVDPEFMAQVASKYDTAERDERNRRLGRAGEELVLHHERHGLRSSGRNDLADRVRWVSDVDGDGAGYDILSFEPNGRERLLEVKTTNGWERTPFHITPNELAVADRNRETWNLIRVWNFAREPRAFSLQPPLQAHVELTPTSFRASLQ